MQPVIPPHIKELATKWMEKGLNAAEKEAFDAWYTGFNDAEMELTDHWAPDNITLESKILSRLNTSMHSDNITQTGTIHRMPFFKRTAVRYAAALILIAGAAAFAYNILQPHKELVQQPPSVRPSGIHPGGNKAILTLADGSAIVLDSTVTGELASQGSTRIIQLNTGALAYLTQGTATEQMYNTVTTPKGGQYQVVLPDGSKVWLNAASGIRFPAVFLKNRTVEITGECYIEVATDKARPFLVKSGPVTLQVLGTSFNMNAYANESSVKTTLITGSVRVANTHRSTSLKPGEQAIVKGEQMTFNKQVNISQVLAWKNGFFNFDDVKLDVVMRQLARWYDLDVIYENGIPDKTFEGEIGRDTELPALLQTLARSGVHYRMGSGKQLIILP